MNSKPGKALHPDAIRVAVRKLVKESARTQKEIGKAVGKSETDFSKIMRGVYELDTPVLVQLINELGVSWETFSDRVGAASVELNAEERRNLSE